MKSFNYCLKINTYYQALEILKFYKASKKIPILYFDYNIVNKLSPVWLFEMIYLLINDFGKNKFQTCVNVNKNYGLFINLIEKKINFLEVNANKEIMIKLKGIAKVNKVLINPNFSVLDLTKTKNIKKKLIKINKKIINF